MMLRCYKIYILSLLVDLSLSQTMTSNITVLASIYGYYKTFYCVIKNDDSAITWIGPDVNDHFAVFDRSDNLDIHCDMNPQQNCSKYWTMGQWRSANSLDFVPGPILDHRWERLKDVHTGDDYEVITNILNHSNFEISFSIRIEKDAHFFLCDGKYPPKANCYWFILSGWEGLYNVIRKCKNTEIPDSEDKYPNSSCKDALDMKNDTSNRVSISEWSHFIVQGNQGTFTLRQFGEQDPFLTYSDRTDAVFKPDHLIIKSRNGSEGIWKFHLFDFLFTTQEEQVQLGPPIESRNGMVCIALFVKMCGNCRLNLTLKDSSDNTLHVHQQHNVEWTEVKLSMKNLPDGNLKLQVSTESNDPNRFWALDDVRRCTENGIRNDMGGVFSKNILLGNHEKKIKFYSFFFKRKLGYVKESL